MMIIIYLDCRDTLVCRINVPARSVFFVFLPAGTFICTRHDPMFTSTRHDYLGNILSSNVPACQMPPGTFTKFDLRIAAVNII